MTEPNTTAKDRAVTRADVAKYAGVSTAVVSYVINNGPRTVAPSTAERVRRAIELLDYRPNVNAQALRRGTAQMLGLVVSDPNNPFFTEFVAEIGRQAFELGFAVMIATTEASLDRETQLIDDLVRRQVAGLIVASAYRRPDLALSRFSRNASIVWIDSTGPILGYSAVGLDGERGAAEAVKHLINVHGHRRIGMLVGGVDSQTGDPRDAAGSRLCGLPTSRTDPSPGSSGPGRAATKAAGACSAVATRPRRSSPAQTCRRSGCSALPMRPASGFRRTWPSWPSTGPWSRSSAGRRSR